MRQAPEMRGSHLKANVESLAHLGPEPERAIRDAVHGVVRAVEESSRVAWLPLALDVELTEAVDRACGRARMKHWCRDAIARSTEGPLLRPLILGLQALGFAPHNTLKRAPYGWTLIYRGCGELRYERVSERECALVQDDVAPAMLASEPYLDGIAGAFEAAIAIAGGRDPEVTAEHDLAQRRVLYRCRWA
jgi:hypothetical protein